MIKYILLGFLNYQPMTGYDLKQAIDNSTSHFWHAYHSQIYTTLRQMEQEGLVTSQFIQEQGQPDRRVYTISAAGKQALKDWLDRTPTEMTPIKEELLVRTFFSAQRDPQKVIAELLLQREMHQRQASLYQGIVAAMDCPSEVPEFPGVERERRFWRLTLDMGMRYEAMYLDWLDHAIECVREMESE